MFLISNHILSIYPNIILPRDTVIRINCAWVKDEEQLKEFIERTHYPIFLDYPTGRKKPPIPNFTLTTAINYANLFSKIKFFAYSNAENIFEAIKIRKQVNKKVEVIPKIETIIGVNNFSAIVKNINAKYVMIDKEDLFVSCKGEVKLYKAYLDKVKKTSKTLNITVLELYGVIFSHD